MSGRSWGTLAGALVMLGKPTMGYAQGTLMAAPSSATQLSATYARYTPFPCSVISLRRAAVAQSVRRLTWRTWWFDTTASRRAADSVAGAVERDRTGGELRACIASYRGVTAPAKDLLGIGLTLLDLDEDAQADTIFHRALDANRPAPVTERAWLLSQLIEFYSSGNPARRRKALEYMTKLDALGVPVAGRRLAAHNKLFDIARDLDSLPFMAEQATRALQAMREIKSDDHVEWVADIKNAFANQADLEARSGNYTAAIALLKQAVADFPTLGNGSVARDLSDLIRFRYEVYGKPMIAIQSTFAYVPGQTTPIAALPKQTPGKATLYVFTTHWALDLSMPLYQSLRRVIEKAGTKLDVTLLTETSGNDGTKLVPDPKDEAPEIREFYHDYLKLPVTLVVWALPIVGKGPDGRVIRGINPNTVPQAAVILVDGKGLIRNINEGKEPRILNMIDEISR